MKQPYLELIHQTLPRLLSLFDTDASSETYGMGDRYHWAWGLIDFGNGTFQGAAHGLARLLSEGLLPDSIDEAAVLKRIDAMFGGADKLRRSDGSLEEAFPYEGSYCVTALVAYDLLSTIELLDEKITNEQLKTWTEIVRPMIGFLCRAKETHAIISNHLATAVAALVKWQRLSGENVEQKMQDALDVVLQHQSREGWFNEYGGADPGYQSLCTYYLADVHRMRPDLNLIEPLRSSLRYLWYFAHPDGSFGGLYGSRNTRFYYPAGIEYLASEIPEAAALASFMRDSIKNQKVVTLAAMDEPNLTPMFNAYCWAAGVAESIKKSPAMPCNSGPFLKHWPESGIIVERGDRHYTVVSTHKGGVCYHFIDEELSKIDPGVLAEDKWGDMYSSQSFQAENEVVFDAGRVEINTLMRPVTRRRSTPFQFIILRMLNLTLMRNYWVREKIKCWLVRLLIVGGNGTSGKFRRVIELGVTLVIDDMLDAEGLEQLNNQGEFCAIHMASQGYWQKQGG